jgi:hypothetical protein
VEDVCKLVSVRELNGIKKIYLLEEKTKTGLEYRIQTEGVNFGACWGMDEINPNTIDCNDIHAINGAYGVRRS